MATREQVRAFEEVVAFMRKHYPSAWPEEGEDSLVEEAKGAVRRDPTEGWRWYTETAQRIRDTGWWC